MRLRRQSCFRVVVMSIEGVLLGVKTALQFHWLKLKSWRAMVSAGDSSSCREASREAMNSSQVTGILPGSKM